MKISDVDGENYPMLKIQLREWKLIKLRQVSSLYSLALQFQCLKMHPAAAKKI